MRLLKAAVVLAVLFVTTMIPAWCQDLVAVAPKAAKVVYEDARIRVVRLRIEPNEALPTHDRPRRVIIPLTTSVVNSTRPDGRTRPSRSIAGQAVWGEPAVRSLVNLADPVDNIIVELKQASVKAKPLPHPPTSAPSGYLEDRFHHWAFENQYVCVYDMRIPPGETTDFHLHALDSVFVRVTAGLVGSQDHGREWTKAERLELGSVEVSADASHPKTHRVRNEGTAEYHVVLVQLKNAEVRGAQTTATHDQKDSLSFDRYPTEGKVLLVALYLYRDHKELGVKAAAAAPAGTGSQLHESLTVPRIPSP